MQRPIFELGSGLVLVLSVGLFLSIIALLNVFVVLDIVLGSLGVSERTIRVATAAIWFVSVWLISLKVVRAS